MPHGYGGYDEQWPARAVTEGGSSGSTGAMSADDALLAKLTMLRGRLHMGGFSDVEIGAVVNAYLRNWGQVIMEGGSSGSTGA